MNSSWYSTWFDSALYRELYAHRDAGEAARAVSLFQRITNMRPGSRLLDLACGGGRHAAELARRGYRVTGVDLSAAMLVEARSRIVPGDAAYHLARCDMRLLPFEACFDGVVHLFTGFGYFANAADDERVLGAVAGALRRGGWYMLDFLNADFVRSTLEPRTETVTKGGYHVVQERSIANGRVEKRITARRNGETLRHAESVRLYTHAELEAMLAREGFHVGMCFGSYAGERFDAASSRCIIFSTKGDA